MVVGRDLVRSSFPRGFKVYPGGGKEKSAACWTTGIIEKPLQTLYDRKISRGRVRRFKTKRAIMLAGLLMAFRESMENCWEAS